MLRDRTNAAETTLAGLAAQKIRARFDAELPLVKAQASRAVFLCKATAKVHSGWGRWRAAGAAILLGAVISAFALWPGPHAKLGVVNVGLSSLSARGPFEAASRSGSLEFSDGSRLTFAPNTQARLARLDAFGADVVVARGNVNLQVRKRSNARWAVLAGPYQVRVTGTRFAVDWDPEAQRFSVAISEGSVLVEGPSLPGPRTLVAGQSLVLPPKPPPPAEPTRAAASEGSHEGRHEGRHEGPHKGPPPPPQVIRPAHPDRPWATWVAAGRYQDVVEQARAANLNRLLNNASLAELTALGDAARYANDRKLARQALVAQRKRFSRSQQASMATYLLGRLAEDEGAFDEAVQWYDRYLNAFVTGTLSEESLGRKMLALERAKRYEAAQTAARAYQERFPTGAFAAAARRIVTGRR